MIYFLDIETMRNAKMLDRLPTVEAKTGNLKDPAKIEEKIREAQEAQIEKMALNPLYGKICAIVAISELDIVTKAVITNDDNDDDERIILQNIFDEIITEYNTIVTYNGKIFDIPFLYKRACLLGIVPSIPLTEYNKKYNNKYQIDIMEVWCGSSQYEKLDNLSQVFCNDHKIDIDFHDFPELIKTPEGRSQLLDYCEKDVLLLKKIYFKMYGILFN